MKNSNRFFQKNPAALIDLIFIIIITASVDLITAEFDLVKRLIDWIEPATHAKIDQTLIILLTLVIGLSIFSIRRWRKLNSEIAIRASLEQTLKQSLTQIEQERERTESLAQTLQAERDTLQTIMENTPAHLAYLDPQFNFVRVNSAYVQGSGHSREQLIGHNHFELFPNSENQAIFEQVSYTGQPVKFYAKPFEYPDQPERGTTFWDWSLVPVKNTAGEVQGLVFSLLDVTDRKRMEDDLRRARDELELRVQERTAELSQANEALQYQSYLLANVSDAIIAVDMQQTVTGWNYAAEELYGWTADEALGQPITTLIPTKFMGTDWATIKQGMAETGRWHGEVQHHHRDGTPLICEVTTIALKDEANRPGGYIGTIRDISQRKQRETMLRQQAQIIDQIHDAVVSTDLDGYVTSWNKGAIRMMGYGPEETLGRHISFVYPEDQYEFLEHELIAPLKAKGEHTNEVKMQNKAGQAFYAHISLSLLRNEAGVATGMIGYSMDITARKQAEETLQRYILRLEVLQKIDRSIIVDAQLPEEIADNALRHILSLLVPNQWAGVILFDFEANKATLLAIKANGQTQLKAEQHYPLDSFGDIDILRQGRQYLVNDIQTMGQRSPIQQQLLAEGMRSYLSVPLILRGQLMGSLNLSATQAEAFDNEHIETASQLAMSLAIALQNARLFRQVQQGRERLQALSKRLVESQEVERRRIARELHDEIGQTLTAVKINLQGLQQTPDGSDFQARLTDSIDIAEHALQQVRNLSLDLRPSLLDDLGLVATVRWYLKRQAQWGGFTTKFVAEPAEMTLSPELEITCFRVAQEALTNVMRHARAQHVQVELQQQGKELVLTIMDDGVGFEVQAALDSAAHGSSLGLLGIQERVMFVDGQLKIESQPGCGSKLEAHFPLEKS